MIYGSTLDYIKPATVEKAPTLMEALRDVQARMLDLEARVVDLEEELERRDIIEMEVI